MTNVDETQLSEPARLDSPEFFAGDPYPVFARLRREAPVHWYEPGKFWAITRHSDVKAVSLDPATYSVAHGTRLRDRQGSRRFADGAKPLFQTDPPEHTTYRRMIVRAFTPRQVRAVEGTVRRIARKLLDSVEEGAATDFVAAVAEPLPIWVIAGMLGLPREDWERFKHWSDVRVSELDTVPGSEDDRRVRAELDEYFAYLKLLLERRRRHPEDDLISLIAGEDELSMGKQIQMLNSLVVAGNETTRSSMSCAVESLARCPAEWAKLEADPARVAATAAEEVLRWATPIRHFGRTATKDTVLNGTAISAGDFVVMYYPSANRDESVWDDADGFDVTRPARPHLTFGTGIHTCAGAPLARLEIQVLLEELVRRFRRIDLAGVAEKVSSVHVNQYKTVPLRLHTR